jgi:hypothetical protein
VRLSGASVANPPPEAGNRSRRKKARAYQRLPRRPVSPSATRPIDRASCHTGSADPDDSRGRRSAVTESEGWRARERSWSRSRPRTSRPTCSSCPTRRTTASRSASTSVSKCGARARRRTSKGTTSESPHRARFISPRFFSRAF